MRRDRWHPPFHSSFPRSPFPTGNLLFRASAWPISPSAWNGRKGGRASRWCCNYTPLTHLQPCYLAVASLFFWSPRSNSPLTCADKTCVRPGGANNDEPALTCCQICLSFISRKNTLSRAANKPDALNWAGYNRSIWAPPTGSIWRMISGEPARFINLCCL